MERTAPRAARAKGREREMFCVAGALLGDGDLALRLLRAFLAARRFLSAHSAVGVVAQALERREHRDRVIAALESELHVGFMAPNDAGVETALAAAAARAGFAHGHARFASAVIALELGELTRKPSVPTTILKAHSAERDLVVRYVEAFVPREEPAIVKEWIADGVATHVGLRLASPAAIPEVVEAFLDEGYRLPDFMRGGTIANAAEGSIVAYVERLAAGKALRIELFSKAEPLA